MERSEGESGFTLLELVIALGVLSIAIGGLISVFGVGLRTTAVDVHRTDAVALATQELAALRTLEARSAPVPAVRHQEVNGQAYSITDTAGWQRSSRGDDQAYREVAVEVAWADQGASHSVTQSSAVIPSATPASNCGVPEAAVGAGASSGGTNPAIIATWSEPAGPVAIDHWEIDLSPDGTRWTTSVGREGVLVPGATHAVELGGLTPGGRYSVRIGAYDGCGAVSWTTVSAVASGGAADDCGVASTTLGPPVAARSTSGPDAGSLTGDVTVEVAATGPCPDGLWASAVTTSGSVTTVSLTADGTGYSGVLAGTAGPWDLGRHEVEIFAGTPTAGAPTGASPLSVAVLCVEPAGTSSC